MKTFKKLSAILLALMLIASCLSGMPTRAAAADGDVSEEITTPETTPEAPAVDPNEETTEWYNADESLFILKTLGEFKGFVTLSQSNAFKGKTIILNTDIVWDEDTWTGIGDGADGFAGTFDGQGHTISGIRYNGGGYAAVVARLYGGTVRNLRVVDSTFESNGAADSFHNGAGIVGRANNGSTVSGIYTNATFKGVKGVGIVAFNDSAAVNVSNCWFDGAIIGGSAATNIGGMVGTVANSVTHTFTNCLFTGTISGPSAYAGGIAGIGPYGAKTNMTNCLVAGDMTGVTSGVVGSVIGNNPGGNGSVYTNVYATAETHANLAGAGGDKSKFTVTKVNLADILGVVPEGLTGWTARDGEVAVPSTTVASNVVVINNAEDLLAFAAAAKTSNFSGKTVCLANDIVLNEGEAADWATSAPANAWTPIGSVSVPFVGTFDGMGHTISGLYLNTTATDAGLFGGTGNGAVIKNFKLINSYIESSNQHVGSIVGRATGTQRIENVYSDADIKNTFTSNEVKTGGFVGSLYGATTITIKNCEYAGDMNIAAYGAGGFVGFNQNAGTINLERSAFTGTLTGANHMLGGFFGNNTNASFVINMTDCMSTGVIVCTHASNATVGQMIGRMSAGTANSTRTYGVLNTFYKTSTSKDTQIGQGTVTGATALISNKARALMEQYYRAGIYLDFAAMAQYYATTTPFEISTVGQLFAFNLMAQCYDFSGKTVNLTADITINEGNAADWATTAPKYNWTPVGGMSGAPVSAFKGTFNGQGHTISGLYCAYASGNSLGFFREVQGTVTNFKLVNSYLANTNVTSAWGYNGGIASFLNGGTISKVYTNAIVETIDSYAGGIVGYTSGATATVSECVFDGTLNARCELNGVCTNQYGATRDHARFVGGIVGNATATSTVVKDTIYSGLIINTDNGAHRTAGIVGGTNNAKDVTITGCFSIGDFRADVSSYHFSMIMDLRGDNNADTSSKLTNLETVFTDNYVLTQKLYNMDGSATLNANGNLTGCSKNEGVTTPSTIRYTEEAMIAAVSEHKRAGTSPLDFENVWHYDNTKLPALKWMLTAEEMETYSTGIKLTAPAKVNYLIGEELDLTGLKLAEVFSNDDETVFEDYTVSEVDMTTVGTKTVTVTYNEVEYTFEITVSNPVTGIEITNTPKTEYLVGDELDTTGLEITVTYHNGDTVVLTEGFEVSGFDSETAGTKTITVTYEGKTAAYTVTVAEPVVMTGIEITAPTKVNYFVGEELNVEGLVVEAVYSDGSKVVVDDYTVSGFSSAAAGENTVKVSYNGYEKTFNVNIVAIVVTDVALTAPTKVNYLTGEELDLAGMKLVATYNNGTTAEITEGYTVSGFDSRDPATVVVTVTYEGFEMTFSVNVVRELRSIEVTAPTKTNYLFGEELDLAGLVVKANYNDKSAEITEGYVVSGYEAEKAGEQTVTVTYEGFTATFTVTVAEPIVMTGIEITTAPKTAYNYGEAFTTEGLVVSAIYSDGHKEVITGYTVTGFTGDHGEATITVTAGEFTATYKVTVAAIQTGIELSGEYKTEYKYAETLDTTGLIVVVTYSDGTTAEITEGFTVTGHAPETAGEQTITVAYEGLTATYTVTVAEREPVYVQILKDLESVTVKGGETASVTVDVIGDGLTFVWYYMDNSTHGKFWPATPQCEETYSVEMTKNRNGRSVYCVITDQYGNSVQTATATLNIENNVAIVTQPQSVAVKGGEMAEVTVEVTGENLTYAWYYKDTTMADFMYTKTFTGDTYSVEMDAARNGRQLYCVVSDPYGNKVTTETVTISAKNEIAVEQLPDRVYAKNGEMATVTLDVTGENLTYKWYYLDATMSAFMYTKTFTGNTYSVEMNAVRNGRAIYCVVVDECGNEVRTNTVILTAKIDTPVAITAQPVDTAVEAGEKLVVSIEAEGEGLTYRWYYKEGKMADFMYTKTFTGNTYTVGAMTASRSGRQIYCVVTDAFGNSVTSDTVTIAVIK